MSFYDDLARLRYHVTALTRTTTGLRWPGAWPRVPYGPRSVRWPIDTVSLTSAVGLAVVQRLPVVLQWTIGLAWAIGVALAMTTAAVIALVLFTFVSVPASILAAVIDTTTVIRGGVPPDGIPTRRAQRMADDHHDQARQRLAALRDEATKPAVGTH